MIPCGNQSRLTSCIQTSCKYGSGCHHFRSFPPQTLCLGHGFAHQKVPKILEAQTGSRHAAAPVTETKTGSCSSADECFLRPFLTREEYLYWSSHLKQMPSSRAWSNCAACRNITFQHSFVQNFTGTPHESRPKCTSYPTKSAVEHCSFSQSVSVTKSYATKTPQSSEIQEKMVVNSSSYHSKRALGKNRRNVFSLEDEKFGKAPSSSRPAENLPCHRQIVANTANATKRINSKVTYNSESAHLRRISEKYLCGDESFGEGSSISSSTINNVEKGYQTTPALIHYPIDSFEKRAEFNTRPYCTLKRKSFAEQDLGSFTKSKRQRKQSYPEIQETRPINATIELSDVWKKFLDRSLPVRSNETGSKISIQHMNWIRHMAGVTSKELGSQAKIRNDGGKPVQLTNEEFEAAKPIPRPMIKNGGKRSLSGGSYALDYDYFPKVVDVLSSKVDTATSELLPN
ncbi:uncharacterized protein [Acropora muricata]